MKSDPPPSPDTATQSEQVCPIRTVYLPLKPIGNPHMFDNIMDRALFRLYDSGWRLATPFLRRSARISDGFEQRTLNRFSGIPADIWIQSASVGEALLCGTLLKTLDLTGLSRLFLTANTRQGIEMLHRAVEEAHLDRRKTTAEIAYFPFDRPRIMQTAFKALRPRLLVLLETEIWPGLLAAAKNSGCRRLIVNGRITPKSLRHYLMRPSIWRALRPDTILAVSDPDAQRFGRLFGHHGVHLMGNMKFDRAGTGFQEEAAVNPLSPILSRYPPFIVLGSVREAEEPMIVKIISAIRNQAPQAVIGLFPRHAHRVDHWKSAMDRTGGKWVLRSDIRKRVSEGTVIIWDTFGELMHAYALARAAFVGGSLAPLGGQNFLEPLAAGIRPVIGPYWDNFNWVGEEIISGGLVRQGKDWRQVADMLINDTHHANEKATVCKLAGKYIKERQGGTRKACDVIRRMLDDGEF